jgi:hypothetical protein
MDIPQSSYFSDTANLLVILILLILFTSFLKLRQTPPYNINFQSIVDEARKLNLKREQHYLDTFEPNYEYTANGWFFFRIQTLRKN